jgi:hypothetical protein
MATMTTRPKRARTQRRQRAREVDKLGGRMDRLARTSAGGSPERAIPVAVAGAVETRARAFRCHRCEGPLTLVSHDAEFLLGRQLRRVDLSCDLCHAPRRLWFALGAAPAN